MCSIAGYVRLAGRADNVRLLRSMNRALAHRGPDGSGLFIAEGTPAGRAVAMRPGEDRFEHRVALAHNRLAIVDLTDAGHQPFTSPDGRYTLAFNGEIYNHAELRPDLEARGWRFRSKTDTEVLLAAYATWGPGAFDRLEGFWALAIWDNERAELVLSRDRFGEAPLFYLWHEGNLHFASEIPALLEVVGWSALKPSAQAIADYLHLGQTDAGYRTFYEGIDQLPQATWARLSVGHGALDVQPYWNVPSQRTSADRLSAQDATEQLRTALVGATLGRLRADVPVGFQLSGGMDSSALVALAAASGRKVAAFTVSYPGTPHDEFPFAAAVAERYPGLIEHHELRAPGDEFWSHADAVVTRYAEPFTGPNVFSSQLTWQAIRAGGMKVCLNGAGGDELFMGYRRDFHAPYLRELMSAGRCLTALRESALLSEDPAGLFSLKNANRLLAALGPARPVTPDGHVAVTSPGSATHFVPRSLFPVRTDRLPRREPSADLDGRVHNLLGDWRLACYTKIGNIASLAVPVELRFPFFDRRVAELALTVPHEYLIRDGWLKWLLRKACEPYLPHDVVWRRRKMGFPFPYTAWTLRSRPAYLAAIADTRCPHVDHDHLLAAWDELARRNPILLWRCMSLTMWWRRCVQGLPLGSRKLRARAA